MSDRLGEGGRRTFNGEVHAYQVVRQREGKGAQAKRCRASLRAVS